jgi:DNA-binding PadR family transcriptional regulator
VQKLLQKGWIETKSRPKTERLYRLTEEGLEAAYPNPTEKATEYSKEK